MDKSATQPVTLSIDLTLGTTRVRMQMQVTNEPLRPVRALPVLRTVSDSLCADASRRLQEAGRPVQCRAGCAACCRYLVPISKTEAWRLHQLVSTMPQPLSDTIRARFASAKDRLEKAGLLPSLCQMEEGSFDSVSHGEAYFSLGLPCPFLEDERCLIYKERPLACREFLVVSSPSFCGQAGSPAVELVTLPIRGVMVASVLGLPAADSALIPLVLALSWAEKNPEPPAQIPAPELLQRLFRSLTAQGEDSVGEG